MVWWQIVLIIFLSITVGLSLGVLLKFGLIRIKKSPFPRSYESRAIEPENKNYFTPELLEEIKQNLSIASEPWAGKLLSFQTEVWQSDTSAVHGLEAGLRQELIEAYNYINLANNIVWFASDLERRSESLDTHYRKLCLNVATRLRRVMSFL